MNRPNSDNKPNMDLWSRSRKQIQLLFTTPTRLSATTTSKSEMLTASSVNWESTTMLTNSTKSKQQQQLPITFYLLLTTFLLLTLNFKLAQCNVVKFEIKEEQPIGTKLGFINENVKSAHSSSSSSLNSSFPSYSEKTKFYFKQNDGLFRFDTARTNLIVTNSTIDRDQICRYRDPCIISYDVYTNITTTSVNAVSNNGPIFVAGTRQPFAHFVTKVFITIHDVNDNSPKFPEGTPNPLFLDILESAEPGKFYLKLPSAEDADAEQNGEITYTLRSVRSGGVMRDDLFNLSKVFVDESTHGLKLNLLGKLDREHEQLYKYTLVASDNGKSSRQTSLDLIIKIVDVNDNSPQFESSRYGVSLPENSKVGTEIIRVLATDADEGVNGIVKYGWSDDTFKKFGNYFSIDSGSGSIRLKKTLDYEKSHLLGPIHLSVVASDQGASKKSSYTTVTVRIVDVNDNEPFIYFKPINSMAFEGEVDGNHAMPAEDDVVYLQVQENTPPGTEIARFAVVDRDEGRNGQIACDIRDVSLPASAIISTVQIDKQSYINNFVIQTSGEIDRESNPKGFDGFIVCKDHGEPDLNNARRFNLNILDENDNAPIFELNTFQVHIEENLAVGSPIIRTKAKDNDSGENGEITYTIHPLKDKWNNVLSIDEEGTVRTVSNIDYEKMTKMFFDITAQDHGSPSHIGRASLELNIIDVDEYLPAFEKIFYNFTVTKPVEENYLFGRVKAKDKDLTEIFGRVIYKPSSNGNQTSYSIIKEKFSISENYGEIRARKGITESGTFMFSIIAGNPPSRWFPNIKVDVLIQIVLPKPIIRKLNAPVFSFPNETNVTMSLIAVVESKTILTQLILSNYPANLNYNDTTVDLNNKDVSLSSDIFAFSIISGNEENIFQVDPQTGIVETIRNITLPNVYHLEVLAYNVEDPTKNTSITLNVVIHSLPTPTATGNIFMRGNVDLNIIIAIVLACWIFSVLVCLIVFGVKKQVASMKGQRRKDRNRYNCRLETVRNTTSSLTNGINNTNTINTNISRTNFKNQSSINGSCESNKLDNMDNYSDATASLIYNNIVSSNGNNGSRCSSSLRKFNDKFISFNVDDEALVDLPLTDSMLSCPFGENCSLHTNQPSIQRPLPHHACQQHPHQQIHSPTLQQQQQRQQSPPQQQQPNEHYQQKEIDELNYYNEKLNDFYNLPVFNAESFLLSYNTAQQPQQQPQQQPFLFTSVPSATLGPSTNSGQSNISSGFKSFKPLRMPPTTNKSTPASPNHLNPSTFFPITCHGYPQVQCQTLKSCFDEDDDIKIPLSMNLMSRSYREVSKTPTNISLKTTSTLSGPYEDNVASCLVPRKNSESHF